MKKYSTVCAAIAAAAFIISGSVAAAAFKPGDALVYTIRMSQAHGGSSLDSKVTANIDRVDKDGSAHANVAVDAPHMPSSKVEATISRYGEIVPKAADLSGVSGGINPWAMSPKKAKEMYEKQMAAAAPGMLQMNVTAINALAAAAGQRKNLKVGDSWQAPGPSLAGDTAAYKVTGREQHLGRDSFVIAMQSLPGASSTVSGTGYYDAAAHVVVAVHCETNTSQGNQTVDAELAQ